MEDYRKLLATSSKLYGPVKRQGALPSDHWSMSQFLANHSFAIKKWLDDPSQRYSVPPLSYVCGVWINHGLKLIYVRNKKAASTAVVWVSGKKCKPEEIKLRRACWTKIERDDAFTQAGITHQEAWKTYTVFTVTRNPWSRATSGYTYLSGLEGGKCIGPVKFAEFCKEPYYMSRLCDMKKQCCSGNSFRVHVEPFARCAKSESGGLALDYILRYENLLSDWEEFKKVLNARPGVPQMSRSMAFKHSGPYLQQSTTRARYQKAGQSKESAADEVQSSARYAEDFFKCGPQCIRDLAAFYREDIETFGFEIPEVFALSA